MKTDFGALKKELGRLTDVDYLKKEINRVAAEVKKFDVHAHLNPKSRARLEHLEERFANLIGTLQHLQKQVDASLDKFITLVGKNSDLNKKKNAVKTSVKKAKATVKKAKSSVKKAKST